MKPEKLRFAPLIRVSTEKQKAIGESLKTQKNQICQFVKTLGGKIPDYCWKYSGQEHATPDQERKKLNNLLEDSGKGLFDAVIVTDASRWSRDNLKSKIGLKILKKNRIKFFVGITEYNLSDPEKNLYLGLAAEIAEYQANTQAQKSILNRIERAKRGIPTTRCPYGRMFDRKTEKWSIDREKQKKILFAAEQYLKGKGLEKIAKNLNINKSFLWEVLTQKSGDEWTIHFKSNKFNINETIPMKMPRLLSQKKIEAIQARAESNKTFTHGQAKNKYLLGRMIFCNHCGHSLHGQTNHNKRRYYRHTAQQRKEGCKISFIPADEIENAVLVHIFQMLGDSSGMEKAMKNAFPKVEELEKLEAQEATLQRELKKVENQKENIIKAIAKGIISDEEASEQVKKIRNQKTSLIQELEKIKAQLVKKPSDKRLKDQAAHFRKQFITGYYKRYPRLAEMCFEEKRELMQVAFGGKDSEGKKLGVYIEKSNDQKKRSWLFIIKGAFEERKDFLPMPLDKAQFILDIDTDYGDYDPITGKYRDEEVNKNKDKQDMESICSSYHCWRNH